MPSALKRQLVRLRARRIVVEGQDVETTQDLPDRLIVAGTTGRREMGSNSRHKRAHVLVAHVLAIDPFDECRGRADLASPAEHVLIGPGNLEGSSFGRDCELV